MQITIAPPHPFLGDTAALEAQRKAPLAYYGELLRNDDRMRGRVLDVGCGCDFPDPPPIREVLQSCRQLDGVEPMEGVARHPGLTERWCACFEDAPVPAGAYDAVFTFWVMEHIRNAAVFFQKIHDALRPGGVYYGYTPHALHPFAVISRTMQMVSLKYIWGRRTSAKVNMYPAYYHVNRLGTAARAARAAGFASLELHYLPCRQWDTYFPRPLRFVPHLYDRLIGTRAHRAGQLLIFKLEKAS